MQKAFSQLVSNQPELIMQQLRYHFLFKLLLLFVLNIAPLSFAETPPTAEQTASETEEPTSTAAPETEKVTRTEPAPHSQQLTDLLSDIRLSTSELIDLKLESPNFPALLNARTSVVDRGVVIIFPDSRTHPAWPWLTNTLRIGLPNDGWATLSLALPTSQLAAIPKRTLPSLKRLGSETPAESTPQPAPQETPVDTENNPIPTASTENPNEAEAETETEEASDPLPNHLEEIMKQGLAAIQIAQQRDFDTIVLIGIGDGATWASALATNIKDQVNIGLLLLDPAQSNDLSAPQITDLIPLLELPVMDIYIPEGPTKTFANPQQAHEIRQAIANRSSLLLYKQSRLSFSNSLKGDQDWMLSYIKGRLRTLKGMEVIETPDPSAPAPEVLQNQPPGAIGN